MTDHTVVTVVRHFDAAPERVFDAWLDPAVARHFLFAVRDGEVVECSIDARVDGRFRIVDRRDGEDVAHVGTYMEIVRPTRLTFTFTVPQYDPRETGVTIDLVSDGDGALLSLGHSGVDADWAEKTREGWGKTLDRLAEAIKSDA
ncbi:MAG: SRPBCC domain-containing protein [Sphingomonadaceae bacterium]|nr:SRPBCC domain-containing protein [Sphingomonadaceae bacterium]